MSPTRGGSGSGSRSGARGGSGKPPARSGGSRSGGAKSGDSRAGQQRGGARTGPSKTPTGRSGPPRSASSKAGPPRVGAVPRSGGRPGRTAPGRGAPVKERGLGGTQVEGRQAVRELLLAGERRCMEIYLSNEVDHVDIIADVLALADELRVPVTQVSRTKLDSISHTDAPQGIVARAAPIKETPLEDLFEAQESPFLLAVDGVTDPGNLGALLRIAECAGVTGVVLPKHRAVHVTPTVTKTAAGAIEYLPMALVGGLPAAIEQMKAANIWTVGLDMAGDTPIHELRVASAAVCLILGAEGKGLSRLVRQRCDFVASIPLHGRLASLNVASAGAVASYEVARIRSLGEAPGSL
ncbi:MAG: 23S rRNA (guanosine(2251)-2'-O)-methyltransferase RlmB [Microthrixaceae bacterium]